MPGRRIAILFTYAFASMIIPVVLLLVLNKYGGQILTSWIEKNLVFTIIIFLVYGVFQVFIIFPLLGSWAAIVEPRSSRRLSKDELMNRLLSLNDEKLPFSIIKDPHDPNKMIASWKIADEKWIELFAARGLRIQYELRMKIVEEKGVVKAQDNYRKFEYRSGVEGMGVSFEFSFLLFKGISFFQYEKGLQYGIIVKEGEIKIDYAYNYLFNIAEIKNPVIDIITSSGWEFRPVILLNI